MLEELAAQADGDFGEEDGEVGAVEGFGGERVEGGEEFVDRVTGLCYGSAKKFGKLADRDVTHGGLQLHQGGVKIFFPRPEIVALLLCQ